MYVCGKRLQKGSMYVCGIAVCTYAERDCRKEVHTESVVALSNSEGQTAGGTRERAGRVGVTKRRKICSERNKRVNVKNSHIWCAYNVELQVGCKLQGHPTGYNSETHSNVHQVTGIWYQARYNMILMYQILAFNRMKYYGVYMYTWCASYAVVRITRYY